MDRYRYGRRPQVSRRRRWPQSRAAGCLLWVVLLIVLLIVLSALFGGFHKGTKVNGLGPGLGLRPMLGPHPAVASQLSALPAFPVFPVFPGRVAA
jgi:hypothetical protein